MLLAVGARNAEIWVAALRERWIIVTFKPQYGMWVIVRGQARQCQECAHLAHRPCTARATV